MIALIKKIYRGFLALFMFTAFAVGALAVSPVMLTLLLFRVDPAVSGRIIRATWRLCVWGFVWLRLIRLDVEPEVLALRGSVIAANHPSLIDVVLLTALIPDTVFVAKGTLKSNPFLTAFVRSVGIVCDSSIIDSAAPFLKRGWNIVIFPEGTRSPETGGLHPFRRGAAQLALRTGAPLAGVSIVTSRQVLGKHQFPLDVGDSPVEYKIRTCFSFLPDGRQEGRTGHTEAAALTAELQKAIGESCRQRDVYD